MADKEQLWIEAPDGWGHLDEHNDNDDGNDKQEDEEGENEGGLVDLFGNNDPSQCFSFDIKIKPDTTKTIRLRGFMLDSDETDRSTGVTLWQASPRLANYLQEDTSICVGKNVLELGAGLGLVGITCWYLGAKSTVMTDADTHTLQKMRENVQHNCNMGDTTTSSANSNIIDCKQLIWGSPHMEEFLEEHGQYDTILGADVIYTPGSIQPLFDTVACLLKKPHGRFVLSRYTKWSNVDDAVIIEEAKLRSLNWTQPSEGIHIFGWSED